jgi:hypothetical protein
LLLKASKNWLNQLFKKAPEQFSTIKPEQFSVVDIVGFFEYLSSDRVFPFHYNKVIDKDGNVLSHKERLKAGAPTILAMAWEMVQPGGTLLMGNMNIRDPRTHRPRPQLGFTMDVVQWPHIQPRTEEQVLDIIAASDINPENVTIHRTTDGIYDLYELRKAYV